MISAVELTTNNFITFLFRKHFQTLLDQMARTHFVFMNSRMLKQSCLQTQHIGTVVECNVNIMVYDHGSKKAEHEIRITLTICEISQN